MARCRPRPGSAGERKLKILVAAIGRCRDDRIVSLCDEYVDRIRKHASMEWVEVDARDDRALLERLRRTLEQATRVVALDAAGRTFDSERFARHLERLLTSSAKVAFVVGGASGFPAGMDSLVHEKISLSAMTLPHRLSRVLLLEQLYRAFTILRGTPYHK